MKQEQGMLAACRDLSNLRKVFNQRGAFLVAKCGLRLDGWTKAKSTIEKLTPGVD